MNKSMTPALHTLASPWDSLRRFTDARIALGRAGTSQPTAAHLAFQLAHAQARDAVHLALDTGAMTSTLAPLGLPVMQLHSAAPDRASYLQRPDWGRLLDAPSREQLLSWRQKDAGSMPLDLVVVVADGLSALAVHRHAMPLLAQLLPLLHDDPTHRWRVGPLTLVAQGRVAVGDEVGECLGARCVLVLIGERPGLSSPDSLGGYFTWAPHAGRNDAERNCISNVREAGLSPARAAQKLQTLLSRARMLQLSGVGLKDESDDTAALHTDGNTFIQGS